MYISTIQQQILKLITDSHRQTLGLLAALIEIIPNLRVRRILCRTHPLPHPLLQRKMRRTHKFGMMSNEHLPLKLKGRELAT